jgi:hypothetical protein
MEHATPSSAAIDSFAATEEMWRWYDEAMKRGAFTEAQIVFEAIETMLYFQVEPEDLM